jgi:hypothetical protein
MRYFYLLLLALGSRVAYGQSVVDTLGHEKPQTAEEVSRRVVSQIDSTGLCVEVLTWGQSSGLMRTYYTSGHLKEYVPYADLAAGQVHGMVTTWYDNGQLASMQPFIRGQRDGTLLLYYENGLLKRQTRYDAGAELLGQCFDTMGQPIAYFSYEQLPLYPGGQAQLAKEINNALRWPHDVPPILRQFQRPVCINFLVDKDGRIRQPRMAVSSQIPSLDGAVLATIAKLTRHFVPAQRDGHVVPSSYYLPIQFSAKAYETWGKEKVMTPKPQP